MLTNAGMEWIFGVLLAQRPGDLATCVLCVGDSDAPEDQDQTKLMGSQVADAALDGGFPVAVGEIEQDGETVHRLVFQGTFAEDEANFEWREVGIKTADGVLLDRVVRDQGRKAPGSVWTLEAELDLVP